MERTKEKIATNVKTDKGAFVKSIEQNPSKYAFSNPYASAARKFAKGATVVAIVKGFVEGNAIKQGENEVIPVYVVTDKNIRCRVSIEQFNDIEIGTKLSLTKREEILPGRDTPVHFFELESILNTEDVPVEAPKPVEATTTPVAEATTTNG